MQTEWFASWFDSPHYHRLYAHRNADEAAGFIDALVERLRPQADSRMLDLGCGTGRHAKRLASKGYDITGIDLSAASIAMAMKAARPHVRFLRHPLRHALGDRRVGAHEIQVALLGRRAQCVDDPQIFGGRVLLKAGAHGGRIGCVEQRSLHKWTRLSG